MYINKFSLTISSLSYNFSNSDLSEGLEKTNTVFFLFIYFEKSPKYPVLLIIIISPVSQ